MPSVPGKQSGALERILAAATETFAAHGFEGARMDAIAKAAKVNKAAIYYHVGHKRALYAAVLHWVFSELAAHIAEQMKAKPSTQDQLRIVIRALRQLIEKKPQISSIMMHEIASGGRNFPDELVEDFSQIIGLTNATLKKGVAASQFAAAHPVVVYLMAITPMAYYEKIYSDLNTQLNAVSEAQAIPLISFNAFADQLETLVLRALKP